MLSFMGSHLPASGSTYSTGTERALTNWMATQGSPPAMPTTHLEMEAIKGGVTLSCEDAYYVVMDAIMSDAESQYDTYIEKGLFPDDVPGAVRDWGEEELCRSLAIKFGGNPAAMAAAGGGLSQYSQ